MNKVELVNTIAGDTGFTKKDVTVVVDSMLGIITNTVVEGEPVKLTGFGNFTTSTRASREGTNPITKEKIIIPETKNMKFNPSSVVKAMFKG